ncbi:MAG: DUF4956 domain-containing protein [Erysipelotrichaceae bacterium]
MLESFINGLFNTYNVSTITFDSFLICVITGLISGIITAAAYKFKNNTSKSFAITIALLPAIIAIVIMTVNGNIGTSVAVAGAFTLIRFRSVPSSALQLTAVFITLASGLLIGSGYIFYGLLSTVILSSLLLLYNVIVADKPLNKTLQITIPENLNYSEVLDSILKQYTKEYQLIQVKTTNMGSLYRLTYNLKMKNGQDEKEMIDQLRCRNGNLEIALFNQPDEIVSL